MKANDGSARYMRKTSSQPLRKIQFPEQRLYENDTAKGGEPLIFEAKFRYAAGAAIYLLLLELHLWLPPGEFLHNVLWLF